jgi:hypothetical protein
MIDIMVWCTYWNCTTVPAPKEEKFTTTTTPHSLSDQELGVYAKNFLRRFATLNGFTFFIKHTRPPQENEKGWMFRFECDVFGNPADKPIAQTTVIVEVI